MAATRMYKLVATATGSSDGAASLRVAKGGKICSVAWGVAGIQAAAADSRIQVELSKSNTSSITTNDTPGNVISTFCHAADISGNTAPIGSNFNHGPMATPVEPNETLYLNQLLAGTAPTALRTTCIVAIVEN